VTDGGLILVAGVLLALGIGATLLAGRLRVPGLVLFLGLGMAIGSDGLGLIDFADTQLAKTVGIIALSLILFEGGFAAGWGGIRPVLAASVSLATVGTLVTAVVTGLAAAWLLDFSTLEGLLLGSTVAASDAAAIFSVLRGSSLKRRLARTLEAESGMNDPVAIGLTLGFIEWIRLPDYGVADMVLFLVLQLAIGGAVGFAVGRAAVAGFRRVSLASGGLYPVASIAAAALAFGAADTLGGSGFLAVYIAGVMLGSGRIPARRTVGDFHDGLAWVSQIALFLALGLLVFPSGFGEIALDGLLVAGVLMFVARPLATAISTLPAGYSPREVVLLGWAGLRGAVPIVLATFSVLEGVQDESFYNLVFFVVLTSTLLQGATFEPLARALGVTGTEPALPRPLIEVGTIRRLGAEVIEYPVAGEDAIVGRLVSELGLPREALVSVIVRQDQALLPRGSTAVKALDRLHILVREPVRREVEGLFDRWRTGPIGVEGVEAARPPGRAPIFSVRPWRDSDGDAGDPRSVAGVAVIRPVRLRQGVPGALVQLEDGRFAVTGDGVAAVGAPGQLFRYCRERIRRAADDDARAWWQEVAGLVSQRAFR
jgi:cell volume regulation protein A